MTSSEDPYVTCPYNSGHMMPLMRLHFHMVKCPDRVPSWVSCPYNATHVGPPEGMDEHVRKCKDRKAWQAMQAETDQIAAQIRQSDVWKVEPSLKGPSQQPRGWDAPSADDYEKKMRSNWSTMSAASRKNCKRTLRRMREAEEGGERGTTSAAPPPAGVDQAPPSLSSPSAGGDPWASGANAINLSNANVMGTWDAPAQPQQQQQQFQFSRQPLPAHQPARPRAPSDPWASGANAIGGGSSGAWGASAGGAQFQPPRGAGGSQDVRQVRQQDVRGEGNVCQHPPQKQKQNQRPQQKQRASKQVPGLSNPFAALQDDDDDDDDDHGAPHSEAGPLYSKAPAPPQYDAQPELPSDAEYSSDGSDDSGDAVRLADSEWVMESKKTAKMTQLPKSGAYEPVYQKESAHQIRIQNTVKRRQQAAAADAAGQAEATDPAHARGYVHPVLNWSAPAQRPIDNVTRNRIKKLRRKLQRIEKLTNRKESGEHVSVEEKAEMLNRASYEEELRVLLASISLDD